MGKKKNSSSATTDIQEEPSVQTVSYTAGSKAAQRVYGEIEDSLDLIKMNQDRVERTFDQLCALGTGARNRKERDQLMRNLENYIEKVNKDIKAMEKGDLKRLHEEKKREYEGRLLKLKVKVNKQKNKFEKLLNGGDEALEVLAASNVGRGGDLQQRLLQPERDEIELIDLETADARTVGERGLELQQRTKDAAGRIIGKLD
jgi:hypothetical protein